MLRSTRAGIGLASLGITLALTSGAYYYAITPHHSSDPAKSADGLLDRADTLSWGNRWTEAEPLYAQAATLFARQHRPAKALYAKVSEIPADESKSLPGSILQLTQDLTKPESQDAETRLRILMIRGMLETNYDASEALADWQEVGSLALQLRQYRLATRAKGEQGIASFLLGDTATAKKQVVEAWTLSKVEHDPAATVRYASMFGTGLVQLHRYKEALTFLNQAINLASEQPRVAYPTIAVYSKIDALAGLQQYGEAMQLANQSLARLQGTLFDGHRAQVYISRASLEREQGEVQRAIQDYTEALMICRRIQDYRGVADAAGELAQALENGNQLPDALGVINEAIEANTHIPDELYLVPRNLATKADIEDKLGRVQESDLLYRKGITLIDRMIQHASTVNIQRQLLAEMSDVYSGYFASLCTQRRYNEALQILDNVRGRVETEALEHHGNEPIHPQTAEERELTRLNLSLINTDDPTERASLTNAIYTTELGISPSSLESETIAHPVRLGDLQQILSPKTIIIEYVLAEPVSYALAITRETVTPYKLPAKSIIEADSIKYRRELHASQEDKPLARKLFYELLKPVKQYDERQDLIVVPDGSLHLLPFSALQDDKGYLLETHTVAIEPSCTVFALLSRRTSKEVAPRMPYLGVAAWTQPTDNRNPVMRLVTGPQRSQLVPLPDSKLEVETIAKDLPDPRTILLGPEATEGNFKSHIVASTDVIHLALHGYADLDYPDRSALVFAPDSTGVDDGLLQVREIRALHLKAKLVTLSACNTGVGPVGESGIVNLVNAFIEAGADSVVSTLWELEDHSTEHLMANFYSQLAAHDRKVDALRSAQLELLKEGLPPYSWASIQIVGDPNGTL
jgi:CHAT domain-containing protein